MISKKVPDGDGAKQIDLPNLVDNLLIFHPEPPAGRNEWTVDSSLSVSGSGTMRGRLTLRKGAGSDYTVSGKLTNSGEQLPGNIVLKKLEAPAKGRLTFDPTLRTWTAGTLEFDVSFTLDLGEGRQSTGTGTMKATMGSHSLKKQE